MYQRDLTDLIEYVKWITTETSILRQRIRSAEKVICQLRSSGKASVESMLDTLFVLRKKQQKLDEEADALRLQVQNKESIIKRREEEKSSLKTGIKNQEADQDQDFSKLRKQLDDQKALIGNQRKLLNELQVLNEMTQADITKAAEELHERIADKENLNLKINEQMQQKEKLRVRESALQNQIRAIQEQETAAPNQPEEIADAATGSLWNQTKIRTKTNSFFQNCKKDPQENCCAIHDISVKRPAAKDQHCTCCAIQNPLTRY